MFLIHCLFRLYFIPFSCILMKWWKFVPKFSTKLNYNEEKPNTCGVSQWKPNSLKMLIDKMNCAVTWVALKTKALPCKTVIINLVFSWIFLLSFGHVLSFLTLYVCSFASFSVIWKNIQNCITNFCTIIGFIDEKKETVQSYTKNAMIIDKFHKHDRFWVRRTWFLFSSFFCHRLQIAFLDRNPFVYFWKVEMRR